MKIKHIFATAFVLTAVFLGIMWCFSEYDARKAVPVITHLSQDEADSIFYGETSAALPATTSEASVPAAYRLIDINSADTEELEELDGIGEKTARNIVDYRNAHGYFNSIDELSNIPGIGEKTVEALRDKLFVGGNITKSVTSSETEITSQSTVSSASSVITTEKIVSPEKSDEPLFPIDLNSASARELEQLDGVGSVIAQRIVDYANEYGFYSVDELLNVSGIGEKKLEALRPFVTVNTDRLPKQTTAASKEAIVKINLNTASVEELMTINGIGKVTAESIVEYAKVNGFTSVDELINVKGIGEKKLEAIRPYVCV